MCRSRWSTPTSVIATFQPIAASVGFIQAPCGLVAYDYLNWRQSKPLPGVRYKNLRISGSLDVRLGILLPPANTAATRHLFLPTEGEWTAYFTNGAIGVDLSVFSSF